MALAVLSFSLISLLSAHNQAIHMGAESIKITRAVTLAREEMERIFITTLPTVGEPITHKREDYPEFEWKTYVDKTPIRETFKVAIAVYKISDQEGSNVFTLKAYLTK